MLLLLVLSHESEHMFPLKSGVVSNSWFHSVQVLNWKINLYHHQGLYLLSPSCNMFLVALSKDKAATVAVCRLLFLTKWHSCDNTKYGKSWFTKYWMNHKALLTTNRGWWHFSSPCTGCTKLQFQDYKHAHVFLQLAARWCEATHYFMQFSLHPVCHVSECGIADKGCEICSQTRCYLSQIAM
jgi:hypothetical protein